MSIGQDLETITHFVIFVCYFYLQQVNYATSIDQWLDQIFHVSFYPLGLLFAQNQEHWQWSVPAHFLAFILDALVAWEIGLVLSNGCWYISASCAARQVEKTPIACVSSTHFKSKSLVLWTEKEEKIAYKHTCTWWQLEMNLTNKHAIIMHVNVVETFPYSVDCW